MKYEPFSNGVDRLWHQEPEHDLLRSLGASESGLSVDEAQRRLAADGPNELKEAPRVRGLSIFLAQFKSLIVWLLIAAGALSALLGDAVDAIAILAVVALNALIGFYQEYQAEQSIAALRKMTAPQARVRRGGGEMAIPATGVVAGDVLVLAAGDLVAADARLLLAADLKCVESALTGESDTVEKRCGVLNGDVTLAERTNMVYQGTSVAGGSGLAVVVGTAMKTELGRIAGLIAEVGAEAATPLQRKLDAVGRSLVWAALGVVALLFVLGWLRGTPLYELWMTSVGLAVAAVPEGLPAVVTVALSLGVTRMAGRRALVRRLTAVETLGATNVICTDKTGTLTVGEMTARALVVGGERYEVTGEGYGPEGEVQFDGRKVEGEQAAWVRELATVMVGCNQAQLVQTDGVWKVLGDPTEAALLAGGAKAGVERLRLEQDLPKVREIPFDSDRKRSTVIRCLPDGRWRALVNGAPDGLLVQCTHVYAGPRGVVELTEDAREQIFAQIAAMADASLRVLGSAYRDLDGPGETMTAAEVERELVFVGLTGMHDPPRPEARDAIAKCRSAGIDVVMITGDHGKTAAAIAEGLGIGSGLVALTGKDLDAMPDEELRTRVQGARVYARVTAAHKLRIIRAWKANGAVVAMTGDGVNDAPAIQGADIGIAMGIAGTEVTKQAADMIITDDHFATIVAAVEEGRGIYQNIRKTLQFLLAGNTGELILMGAAVMVGWPAPLLPIHLLWVNLVTDGLPALCLAADPLDPDLMNRPPRRSTAKFTDGGFLTSMLLTGLLTAALSFGVFAWFRQTSSLEVARAAAFTVLVFDELLRSFSVRSETLPLWRTNLRVNRKLVVVVALSIALQLLSLQNATLGRFLRVPEIPLRDAFGLLALGAMPMLVLEIVKAVRGSGMLKGSVAARI